jgi:hypothetical protein
MFNLSKTKIQYSNIENMICTKKYNTFLQLHLNRWTECAKISHLLKLAKFQNAYINTKNMTCAMQKDGKLSEYLQQI